MTAFESLPLFDYAESQRQAELGIGIAASNNAVLLQKAREIARAIALERGEVTADDVQARLMVHGYGPHDLGNAAGAIFRGSEWKWTGRLKKSERIHAHSNLLRVWRLAR